MAQATTTEPRELPQEAPDRVRDVILEWFRNDADAGEWRVLAHVFDRMQDARHQRAERAA